MSLIVGRCQAPESSAALVANAFGLFLDRPQDLPPMPGTEDFGWPAQSVKLEACVRFPWAGGRHPWLDVLVETDTHLIGVESKRFEPFRPRKRSLLSDAYWRIVWGDDMAPVESVRDALRRGDPDLDALDATQLVKHMFGLRSESHRRKPVKSAVLVYLYCEPSHWPDGRAIGLEQRNLHAKSLESFAAGVAGAEIAFRSATYKGLLESWCAVQRRNQITRRCSPAEICAPVMRISVPKPSVESRRAILA